MLFSGASAFVRALCQPELPFSRSSNSLSLTVCAGDDACGDCDGDGDGGDGDGDGW